MTYLSKISALSLLVKHSHLYQSRYVKIDHQKYGEFFGNEDPELVEKRLEELVDEKLISRIVTASSSIITVLEEGYSCYQQADQIEKSLPKEIIDIRKAADVISEMAEKLVQGKQYYKDLEMFEQEVKKLKTLLESMREAASVLN